MFGTLQQCLETLRSLSFPFERSNHSTASKAPTVNTTATMMTASSHEGMLATLLPSPPPEVSSSTNLPVDASGGGILGGGSGAGAAGNGDEGLGAGKRAAAGPVGGAITGNGICTAGGDLAGPDTGGGDWGGATEVSE